MCDIMSFLLQTQFPLQLLLFFVVCVSYTTVELLKTKIGLQHCPIGNSFFKKWAIPGLFLIYFRLSSKYYNFKTNKYKKCPSSTWC